jgi:16S rRNA (guanine966-N2)-methyltransferase
MRVTGGTWRGIPLTAPSGAAIRPTGDKARLAIFNALQSGRFDADLDGALVLDGTAGTGAMGIEALSRGASFVHFADSSREAIMLIQANLAKVKAEKTTFKIHAQKLQQFGMTDTPADLVFLDPPYAQNLLPDMVTYLIAANWIGPQTLCVLEAGKEETIALPLTILDRKLYGAAQVLYAIMPE